MTSIKHKLRLMHWALFILLNHFEQAKEIYNGLVDKRQT